MKKKRSLTDKHELTNRLQRKKLSVEELIQAQIRNVYTNKTRGIVSFSASHDR